MGGQPADQQVHGHVGAEEQDDVHGEPHRQALVLAHDDQRVRQDRQERRQDGERELHPGACPDRRGGRGRRLGLDHPVVLFPAPPPSDRLRSSDRMFATISSALPRLSAVIPSGRSRHGRRSCSTVGASRPVSCTSPYSLIPTSSDGIPLNTTTWPPSTPTNHCWSRYSRSPTNAVAKSTTRDASQIASRRRRLRRADRA